MKRSQDEDLFTQLSRDQEGVVIRDNLLKKKRTAVKSSESRFMSSNVVVGKL